MNQHWHATEAFLPIVRPPYFTFGAGGTHRVASVPNIAHLIDSQWPCPFTNKHISRSLNPEHVRKLLRPCVRIPVFLLPSSTQGGRSLQPSCSAEAVEWCPCSWGPSKLSSLTVEWQEVADCEGWQCRLCLTRHGQAAIPTLLPAFCPTKDNWTSISLWRDSTPTSQKSCEIKSSATHEHV